MLKLICCASSSAESTLRKVKFLTSLKTEGAVLGKKNSEFWGCFVCKYLILMFVDCNRPALGYQLLGQKMVGYIQLGH